jgi:hypothetical protein
VRRERGPGDWARPGDGIPAGGHPRRAGTATAAGGTRLGRHPRLVLYAGNLRHSLGTSPAVLVRTARRDAVPSRS